MSSDGLAIKKVIGIVIVLGLGGTLIVGLTKSIFELLSVQERVIEAENRVTILSDKKKRLENEYFWRTSPDYLEQEIRNKLSLAKPNDTVLLLPETIEASNTGVRIEPIQTRILPWKQWWELFFGK